MLVKDFYHDTLLDTTTEIITLTGTNTIEPLNNSVYIAFQMVEVPIYSNDFILTMACLLWWLLLMKKYDKRRKAI